MLSSRTTAIPWAQWRSTRNRFPRANQVGVAFTGIMGLIWYGVFAYLAVIAAYLLSSPTELPSLRSAVPGALLLCFLYWQLIPVLTASMGSSLDIRKLLVYPVPRASLFWIEVGLRVSTSIEMLLLLIGAGVGLALNPALPIWAPMALVPFVAINLLLSAGVRDLLVRLLARKRVREIVVFLLVLCAALPQALILSGSRGRLRHFFASQPAPYWPWNATAELATGEFSWFGATTLLIWVAVVYFFSRWQFARGLSFDRGEASARGTTSSRAASRLEWWYRLPSALLGDPLGVLVEKELRFLSRTPRFRLVFTMGFSFGLLIWLPMAFGRTSQTTI
jgi:ABC-2 type transport system permease protein